MKKPELLLPVGTRDMLLSAIANGADAVYLGAPGWNARGRTEDFSFDEVEEMISFARIHGVKTYIAMNILVFEKELKTLPTYLSKLISLRPDAFIIQDLGLARLIRAIAPEQEIHASTQQTIASAEAANFLKPLGFNRVVLARELSLRQIQDIAKATDLELEVFIHGALCVSYSGQCLTSENFGGRSGNRGQCAQSCRLPYKMFIDGKEKPLSKTPYFFSPRDLSALPLLSELEKIGIASYKVEGRLKTPEYVAAVSKAYRTVIDKKDTTPFMQSALETLFSRGLSPGFLKGVNHTELVEGSFSNHHGEFLGLVEKVSKNAVFIQSKIKPSLGDGIFFEPIGIGGRLYAIETEKNYLKLIFKNDFRLDKIKTGFSVFRNDSPTMEKELKNTFSIRDATRIIPINIQFLAKENTPITLTFTDKDNHSVTVKGEIPEKALQQNAQQEPFILKEISALSGTAYFVQNSEISCESNLYLSQKVLRKLRQQAVLELDKLRAQKLPLIKISKEAGIDFLKKDYSKASTNTISELSVLVRNPEQINLLKGLPLKTVYMDFDWGVDYEKPLEKIHLLGFEAGIATLRVHKPGENHYLRKIAKLAPEKVLVRNTGALSLLRETPLYLVGDYSLNLSNSIAADYLLSLGLQTFHPSLDLNANELFDLLQNIAPNKVEIALHQYLPAFHSEYCAFAAFGAKAKRFPECDKFCTKHKVEILDHKGKKHFLQSDSECRNTLYLGTPRSALRLLPKLKNTGITHFRLEMLDDSPEMVRRKIEIYASALNGSLPLQEAIGQINAEEKYGVSEGQLFNDSIWEDRKK